MAELIQNSSASTLNGTINNVVTSLTVTNGAVFPATGNFRIQVCDPVTFANSELMLCTARATNVLTVTRGVETTTAVGHNSGSLVTHIVTKAGLAQYISENSIAQSIADAKGDLVVATAADTLARFAVGTNGQVLAADSTQSSGVKWVGASSELDYVQITANVNVTATTEATAATLVTGSAVTYDGSTVVMVEFFAPYAQPANVAAAGLHFVLYDGSSSIGLLASTATPAANTALLPVRAARRLTPSAASHTYSVRAYVSTGTGVVGAGVGGGGGGAYMPAFIRIQRV